MYEQPNRAVKCPNCQTLFGYETGNGVLSIKHRDLYRTVREGSVEGPCRRCGNVVRWPNAGIVEKSR